MDALELLDNLRRRPRMFIFDDSYLTMVAFVMGCDARAGGQLLEGFGTWCGGRFGERQSSLHWAALIRRHVAATNPLDSEDLRAKELLLTSLEEYLTS
jgi:hypothetical protein